MYNFNVLNVYMFLAGELYATELDVPLAHQAAAHGNITELTKAIKADPTVLEHQDTEGIHGSIFISESTYDIPTLRSFFFLAQTFM